MGVRCCVSVWWIGTLGCGVQEFWGVVGKWLLWKELRRSPEVHFWARVEFCNLPVAGVDLWREGCADVAVG